MKTMKGVGMNCGKSLGIALAMKGMKRKDLADAVGVVPQQVSNWVSSGSMSSSNLTKVCDVLKMKVSDFVKLGESEVS